MNNILFNGYSQNTPKKLNFISFMPKSNATFSWKYKFCPSFYQIISLLRPGLGLLYSTRITTTKNNNIIFFQKHTQ